MASKDPARRELAALLEADLRTSGAETADAMRAAAEASLRSLMGPGADVGPPRIVVEIVDQGEGRMKVRLKWPAGE